MSLFYPLRGRLGFAAGDAGGRDWWLGLVMVALLTVGCGGTRLAAQGVVAITITNPSFESPTPSVFPDYTDGATGWTSIRSDIPAGTFAPGVSGATPAPTDGVQVGYANGFGGLQEVLAATFAAGTTYYFSVELGLRSDDPASSGAGAIQLGYLLGNGDFNFVTAQSATVARGVFDAVAGSYVATAGEAGHTIVLRLANVSNPQVIFDQVALSATPIPEPAVLAGALGWAALSAVAVYWNRRRTGARVA